MKNKVYRKKNEQIEALLIHFLENLDEYPIAGKIEKDADKAYGELDTIIETKLTGEDNEKAMQLLLNAYNDAQRSGFYAGFQAAKELFTSGG